LLSSKTKTIRPSADSLRSLGKRGGVFKAGLALFTFTGALGVLGWMLLSPDALRLEIESRTGFPVEAETLLVNPFGLTVTGENLVIGNPSSYGSGLPMMEIASLRFSASLPSLGRDEMRIEDMEVHIPRATLVVNESGQLNLDVFTRRLFANESGEQPMSFYAKRVRLIVDELTFVDNSRIIPSRRSLRVSLDTEMHDLEEARDLFDPLYELGRRVGSLPIR